MNQTFSQNILPSTSGWKEYYNNESKISLKHPTSWKCSSWSKKNLYITIGGVTDSYIDEYGRPVYTYSTIDIYDDSIKNIPIYPKLVRSNLSKYESYEYVAKEGKSETLVIYLDLNGKRYARFQLHNYISKVPTNTKTENILRALINSFTIN